MFSAAGKTAAAVSTAANYIEDVFSTWLYTGNGSTQTITNGIDLSTKGGLVWCKYRNAAGQSHGLFDTARGASNVLYSNLTNAQASESGVTAFNTNGFSLGSNSGYNANNGLFAAWTFRKQAKFFDIVTWTGNSTSGRTVAHNLGSVPGCIIVKAYSGADASTANWAVYHRSLGNGYWLRLENTGAALATGNLVWTTTAPTSTEFSLGSITEVNKTGNTYVAYLFAHDAGGFGLTGTDNVISCGSFTTDGSGNATVNLGYEPQWLITKTSTTTSDWIMVDVMRGFDNTDDRFLYANTSGSEFANGFPRWVPTATGFTHNQANANQTYIYIAIRRGPMKTPTTGTSVFNPSTWVGGSGKTTGFPLDSLWVNYLPGYSGNTEVYARLIKASSTTTQSNGGFLSTSSTAAEDTTNSGTLNWSNTGYGQPQGLSNIYYAFRRAPGFFDVVCYTGTGSATTFNHNLGVAPELVIVKWRTGATGENWAVMCTTASSSPDRRRLFLDLNAAGGGLNGYFADSSGTPVLPTATQVYIGTNEAVNKSAATYVAYLFASCPGVSKVGSYTGTGTTLQIDCGFTGGARFVLIKRTDSTGDWYVWDSARGIVAGNDPYLLLNSTAAEVTNTDYVDTYNAGFEISSTAPAAINANGGTFIFLAIA